MKKIKVICLITIFILLTGVMIFLSNYNSSKLVNVEDIKTDDNYENITYDKTEDVWDDSVLGIIRIKCKSKRRDNIRYVIRVCRTYRKYCYL